MSDIRLTQLIAPVFRPVHTDIRRGGHAEYWLKGGRGSGKSTLVSLEIIMGIVKDPDANAIIYRKVANELRGSVYQQIRWAITALGLDAWFRCGLSPMEIVYLPTGQQIHFRGADDPGKSKGIKLVKGYFKYLWFEELTEFKNANEIHTIQASVLRGGARAYTFYTYNPPISAKNWVNESVIKPEPGRLIHHSDYTQIPKEWIGETFLTKAEAMRDTNEDAWRHMYMGEVTGAGGEVFANVRLKEITDAQIKGFDRFYYGLDHGYAVDPAALVVMYYNKATRTLYITGEYVKVGASYDQIADAAKGMLHKGGTITADSAEPRSNDELQRRGLRVYGAVKGPGSVEHGMRWLQGLGAIIIDPARAPCAAKEFSTYEYEPDNKGGFKAAYPDKENHTIDAARYGLEPVIGQRKAGVPKRGIPGI